jgi:hypothetical protein
VVGRIDAPRRLRFNHHSWFGWLFWLGIVENHDISPANYKKNKKKTRPAKKETKNTFIPRFLCLPLVWTLSSTTI